MEKALLVKRIISLFKEYTDIEQRKEEIRKAFIEEFGVEPDSLFSDYAEKIIIVEEGEEGFNELLDIWRNITRRYHTERHSIKITLKAERMNLEGRTSWTLIDNQLQKHKDRLLLSVTIGDIDEDP